MRNSDRFTSLTFFILLGLSTLSLSAGQGVDFNQDIRAILSDNCFRCHGPDEEERKGGNGGLRLDTFDGAQKDLGGYRAITPGNPDQSELLRRVTTTDADDIMPPPGAGTALTKQQTFLLNKWIEEGAQYAKHWSYVPPSKPALPTVSKSDWPKNAIDSFILARLDKEELSPSPQADRYALARRLSLDLTGLPPSIKEVDDLVNSKDPKALEHYIDHLLTRKTFGEHWARMWLDLARYADSAGYADDPARTIWGYRDYVIRAFNANKPFNKFTIEQLAGDLLEDPSDEQLVATAFHRNTLTNNEGGTNDEEYRNVAIVDRVNTTMAVWMGTTMACAQCHTHKYDPITQKEYFSMFAILNNTEDADRRDESPRHFIYSDQQREQQKQWKTKIAQLKETVTTMTPELKADHDKWLQQFGAELSWTTAVPSKSKSSSNASIDISDKGLIRVSEAGKTDTLTFETGIEDNTTINAIRLNTLPIPELKNGAGHAEGNFVISQITGAIVPPDGTHAQAQFVRIEIPGKKQILSLAEVQVFNGADNIALKSKAKQSSTDFGGPAEYAIDNNTDGEYTKKSVTHTAISDNPWFELDLQSPQTIDRIILWNRTDNATQQRLSNFKLSLFDKDRNVVWEQMVAKPPMNSAEFSPSGTRSIKFNAAFADYSQKGFPAASAINNGDAKKKGWAVGGQIDKPHQLTLIPDGTVEAVAGSTLQLTIKQLSEHEKHTLGNFSISTTSDPRAALYGQTPADILAIVKTPVAKRSDDQQSKLRNHFLSTTPKLKANRDELAKLEKQLREMKAYTSVPILRELAKNKQRTTKLQYRGNFLDTGEVLQPALPSAFNPSPTDATPTRLDLAHWLIDNKNPLTARVAVNRFWESLFGIGIVRTSEEFGSQGERPSHPQLLDWLATEFVDSGWDVKHIIKLMVSSAAYQQSSRVTPDLIEQDPANRWYARGPRFRLSAEMIRDQAMAASGLLSSKMYGPPVKPPQPNIGLKAAFGGGIDWKTSGGEDKYRRGLYTTWRRSSPYPSMAAFDAPNREVCTVRRERTNTPLQALVTLNDPVYVEAAQALARRMISHSSSAAERAKHGFRICLSRPPTDKEVAGITKLYDRAHERFKNDTANATITATKPIGPVPDGVDTVDLAAWTVVANVLLNLDETLMKR